MNDTFIVRNEVRIESFFTYSNMIGRIANDDMEQTQNEVLQLDCFCVFTRSNSKSRSIFSNKFPIEKSIGSKKFDP